MALVSVCRGTKSGGQAFAECLAEHLGYPVVGREILQAAASDLEVSEADLARQFERAPRLWDRLATARRVYIVGVQAALAEHVTSGNLVYHGLAGRVLLRGLPCTLRARLIAPLEARMRVLVETEGMDRESAERHIRRVDAERKRWVKMMYGEDIEDPALYDMVINLATMSLEAACALTAATLRQPEFTVTDEVRATLENFRLACRVKRALVTAPDTRGFPLEARADGGLVEVSGSAPVLSTGATGDRIAEISRAVPGVRQVRLKLQWFDPYP
jgi:cytidylate kinase